MTEVLSVPPATAPVEDLADWLELRALASADLNSSIQDLVQELRRSGTAEAVGDPEAASYQTDGGGDVSYTAAEAAFGEIETRHTACGADSDRDTGHYPFEIGDGYIELKEGLEGSAYVFLLLLSRGAKAAGGWRGPKPTSLFEDVCLEAAKSYLGGPVRNVGSVAFGFPRRTKPKGFAAALDSLCEKLGEGEGCRKREGLSRQKDGRLDLVVWRDFGDRRRGKFIGFGQCATSRNDRKKAHELNPSKFCQMWMRDVPVVPPVSMFFVPWRVEPIDWHYLCMDGGILFDRCRIVEHAGILQGKSATHCLSWNRSAIRGLAT